MSSGSRYLTPYTICFGALLSNLSAGMFNIALVDIADSFSSTLSSAQWIVTVYLLVISILLPIMGKFGDLLGRTRIHNAGYFIFMAGALGCALSPSLKLLILSRVVQGIGASMYQATNMALIVHVFPKEQRGRALGMISTFVAAGSLAGPGLGGFLMEWLSWRSSFWILVCLSLTAWILARRFIPKDNPDGGSRLDVPGAALFAVSLTGFVSAINMGGTWGWGSWQVGLPLAAAAAGGVIFAAWCKSPRRRWGEPFIKLSLFREPGMAAGIGITVVTYMAAFSAQLVLPVFLQMELGFGPAVAGMIMMGYPLSLVIFSPLFGGLSDKLGIFPLLSGGLLLMTATLGMLGFLSADYSVVLLIILIVLLGGAMGMVTSPNNSLMMGRVPKKEMGLISSLIALSRNLGMMFGTAAGGITLGVGNPTMSYRLVFILCMLLTLISYMTMLLSFRSVRQKETLSS
ncbi:MFS transporter [Paenibacillus lemnae]|uniref:MFS transporter n=1 Tax=Paenibacillus lemnae TaxID=1330551 RepID=A0A848M2P0_PAELE|nr:MFS transporter [Paenibacillus lemnae]NMO95177.1 MFS transporter [Paenibacillus lemnae]